MKTKSEPKYGHFGQAHPFKVYRGDKSVSLRLAKDEAYLLAEGILRAANKWPAVDLAIYPASSEKAKSRVSVLGSKLRAPEGAEYFSPGRKPWVGRGTVRVP